ncbi:MAG: NRDE family protein [Acidobacteriota bacterium]
MCTVTWTRRPGGYELFFNRDESLGRGRAELPRVHGAPPHPGDGPRERRGPTTTYLAPVDSDAGGTWIAVNRRGLTVCLLNRYQDQDTAPPPRRPVSRGLLVARLARMPNPAAVHRHLEDSDLEAFRPFDLVVAGSDAAVTTVAWDGRSRRSAQPAEPPMASSGYDSGGALRLRRDLWREQMGKNPAEHPTETFLEFHRSHYPEKGAYSPCMHRSDARTVSLTHVRVEPQQISMAYADGQPCTTPLAPPLHLDRDPAG